jgi:hypothetical protein
MQMQSLNLRELAGRQVEQQAVARVLGGVQQQQQRVGLRRVVVGGREVLVAGSAAAWRLVSWA